MRDWKTTRFTKVIRLTPEHSNYVNSVKGKKSKAGKLEEIIDFYKKKKQNKIDKKELIIHSNHVEHSNYVEKTQGNKVLDIFYQINPTIDYAKPFERRAAEWLINKFGLEQVQRVAKFACDVQGMPYAPRITKPTQLKDKWADLQTFAIQKKNEMQSKKIIEV